MAQDLHVLQTAPSDPFEADWLAAARRLGAALDAGADLAPALPVLHRAFAQAQQLATLQGLAAVLVRWSVAHSDLAHLHPLMQDVPYGAQVILGHMQRHAAKLPNRELLARFLLDALSWSTKRQVFAVAWTCWGGDTSAMLQFLQDHFVGALSRHPKARVFLPDLLQEWAANPDAPRQLVAAGLPWLTAQLDEGTLKVRAAQALPGLVRAGVDVASVAPALHSALGDPLETVRTSCAFALAYAAAVRAEWPVLDGLGTAPALAVRRAAVQAMCARLGDPSVDGEPLVSRLAVALLDVAAEVRELAASVLLAPDRARAMLCDPATVAVLLPALADDERGWAVAEYLQTCCAESLVCALYVLRRAAAMVDCARALRLAGVCAAVRDGRHTGSCQRCRALPRAARYVDPAEVPPQVAELLPPGTLHESGRKICPDCGNVYQYTFAEKWLAPADGMGVEYRVELRRLAPSEYLQQLGDVADLQRALDWHRANLDSLEAHLRQDAARALTLAALAQGDGAAIAGLLARSDDAVRRATLAALVEEPPGMARVAAAVTDRLAVLADGGDSHCAGLAALVLARLGQVADPLA